MSQIFAWLMANLATILICAVLVAVVVLIILSMIRDKKRGKSSCGCGCSGCAMSDVCHSQKEKNT